MTRLTIGMATHRDFDGVYFTVNALRLYHAEAMPRCEIVIVDNDPDGPQAESLRHFCSSISVPHPDWPCPFQVRYIPYREAGGTAAPRDHIFRIAAADAVLVLDSHVNLWPGAISHLLQWYDDHPECQDLIQGPLVYDDLQFVSTHFDDIWRDGMWGTWGTDQRGIDPSGSAFEIPAQGLGLFSCRTEAWLGFNPCFREFGGEEWYIHEKFRQHGRRCLCLPSLRWIHRFEAPGGGRAYHFTLLGKVRNYILGLQELGLPLDRLRRHYVEGLNEDVNEPINADAHLTASDFDRLVELVTSHPNVPLAELLASTTPIEGFSARAESDGTAPQVTLEDLYRSAVETPSDINEHCDKLRQLAACCETVVEFGMRRGVSTVALLAGQPANFISVDLIADPIAELLAANAWRTRFEFRLGSSLSVTIPECDLLFIDTQHTARQLRGELRRHESRVRHWIAFHDTEIFGERGDDGGPGLLVALEEFLTEHSEWQPLFHAQHNHGFTIIGRVTAPPLPFEACDPIPERLSLARST
ncbi:glycosyltransferase [Schlesneria sp. T3-172]|uniref:glycosyltransferase n=2 Tax=Schlesneria TaxID=656899 RepID=UPI0037C8A7A2